MVIPKLNLVHLESKFDDFYLGELKIYQQQPLLHLGISDYSPKLPS